VIINPKNNGEYEMERDKGKKRNPEFSGAKWAKESVVEGEEIELSAQVKDIEDVNAVTFQVWKEGQESAVNVALWQITVTVEGGAAKCRWKTPVKADGIPPEEDPKYYFTVHSAWCRQMKSGNLTVKLKRPEITKCEWHEGEGKTTEKGLVGEALKMVAACNGDMEDGAGVIFRVFEEGADPKSDKPVYEAGAENHGGKAEAEWTYKYKRDPDNPLTEKPKYFFTANAHRCKEAKSGNVEISATLRVYVYREPEKPLKDVEVAIQGSGDNGFKVATDAEGYIERKDCIPDLYVLKMESIEKLWELSCDKITTITLNGSPMLPSK